MISSCYGCSSRPTRGPALNVLITPPSYQTFKAAPLRALSDPGPHIAAVLALSPRASTHVAKPKLKEKVLERVEAALAGTHDSRWSLEGVTQETMQFLNLQADMGKLPGWDRLRIDYDSQTEELMVTFPRHVHEVIPSLFTQMAFTGMLPNISLASDGIKRIRQGGSGNIRLPDGQKSPDEALYDTECRLSTYPTVVFEVGLSQSLTKLGKDAARLIGGSGGMIQLVVNLKITEFESRASGKGIQSVVCHFWEVTAIDDHFTPSSIQLINTPLRTDGNDSARTPPLETTYSYVLSTPHPEEDESPLFQQFTISRTEVHDVFNDNGDNAPRDTSGLSIDITYDQLFRNVPNGEDGNKAAISIPYDLLMGSVRERVEHELKDIASRKRPAENVAEDFKLQGAWMKERLLKKSKVAGGT